MSSLFRNFPQDIEDYPIILSNGEMYPPLDRTPEERAGVFTAGKPAIPAVPVADSVRYRPGHTESMVLALNETFLKYGMPYIARGSDILRYREETGNCIYRSQLISSLTEDMGKEGARKYFDQLSGKDTDRHPKKSADKGLSAEETLRLEAIRKFKKLVVDFVTLKKDLSYNANSTTNSKRGPKPKETVYVPTEAEWISLFVAARIIDKDDPMLFLRVMIPNGVMRSSTAYKNFILTDLVERNGERPYPLAEIGGRVGRSKSSVKKTSQKVGQKVTVNQDPGIPVTDEIYANLPDTDEISKSMVKLGQIWGGLHIVDGMGLTYGYSKEGVDNARKFSGNVRVQGYLPSTYTPKGDRGYVVVPGRQDTYPVGHEKIYVGYNRA